MKFSVLNCFLLLSSLLVVSLGQPSLVPFLGPLAAIGGYTLFWIGLKNFPKRKSQILWAILWYSCVQGIQLSWMTSIEYQGYYILFVYVLIIFILGLQFSLFCIPLLKHDNLSYSHIITLACLWTLFEWGRMQILCGFSWNPAGLALSCYSPSMQFSSIFGSLGLSFLVIFTNLLSLKFILTRCKKPEKQSLSGHAFYGRLIIPIMRNNLQFWRWPNCKLFLIIGIICLFPYFFGLIWLGYHHKKQNNFNDSLFSINLIQTALMPSEKVPLKNNLTVFVSPWKQWERMLELLAKDKEKKFDLIVFPEAAVPFSARESLFPLKKVLDLFCKKLGLEVMQMLPPLEEPFAKRDGENWLVSNLFWFQTISNYFNAEIVAGIDDYDKIKMKAYNAAFYFTPKSKQIERYKKRILLPLAEYLPFKWCRKMAAAYGIENFFSCGKKAKIFKGKHPLSVSICYEDTFSFLVREGRALGANLLVNITNDSWYPFSRLPEQHYQHARLRAVENGAPLIRACNIGVTCVVDCFGREIGRIGTRDQKLKQASGNLNIKMSTYHFKTPFVFWGNGLIIRFCFFYIIIFLICKKKKREKEIDLKI